MKNTRLRVLVGVLALALPGEALAAAPVSTYSIVARDPATGDLGGPAYRKFDLEAWMPGRGDGGEYGEVTSTSNCTDYQARRLKIRYKAKGEKGTKFVHTLNGTAIACSRAIIAVMENYQQADGSIVVPEVLQPYMRMERIG